MAVWSIFTEVVWQTRWVVLPAGAVQTHFHKFAPVTHSWFDSPKARLSLTRLTPARFPHPSPFHQSTESRSCSSEATVKRLAASLARFSCTSSSELRGRRPQQPVATDIQPAVRWTQRSSSPLAAAPLPPLFACSVSRLSVEDAELFRWMWQLLDFVSHWVVMHLKSRLHQN